MVRKGYVGSRSLKYPPSEDGFPWVGYVELDGEVSLVLAANEKRLETLIRATLKKMRTVDLVTAQTAYLEEIYVHGRKPDVDSN